MQILQAIEKDLTTTKTGFDNLLSITIPTFNKTIKNKIPTIEI